MPEELLQSLWRLRIDGVQPKRGGCCAPRILRPSQVGITSMAILNNRV